MQVTKNILVKGTGNRPMPVDIFYEPGRRKMPVIVYAHGFNGFKDWAYFDLIARQFAAAGFVFIKFNFSHNGTTPEHPDEFTDLVAYAKNNYTTELNDLDTIIDWTLDAFNPHAEVINAEQLSLIGHSRGGGIVLLKAAEDYRVKAVITWASVAACTTPWGNWSDEKIAEWKNTGVQYILNSRTKQEMPLYFQLYENFQEHRSRLDIEKAIHSLSIPVLICHGTEDEAVPVEKAHLLKSWQSTAELFIVNSDHVFGRKHPWANNFLPVPMQEVVDKSIQFIRSLFQ
jgi:uncharacterized protein